MKSTLRILLLEDSALDARLIEQELKNAGVSFCITRIQTEAELRRELEPQLPDLILSDHGLPSFNGFTALEIVREKSPDLPFIFVSGSNNQGMVTEMYERGATDYVYKHDIEDLPGAVRRALEPRPETESFETESASVPQTELDLGFPHDISSHRVMGLPFGNLAFCPKCMQTRDHTGALVQLENCLATCSEIVIVRQICASCAGIG